MFYRQHPTVVLVRPNAVVVFDPVEVLLKYYALRVVEPNTKYVVSELIVKVNFLPDGVFVFGLVAVSLVVVT